MTTTLFPVINPPSVTASYIDSLASANSEVELKRVLAAINKRVTEIQVAKSAEARLQVSEFIKEHGYEALGLIEPKAKKSASEFPAVDKYRDPLTGATYSGRGGLPAWADGSRENLKQFVNPHWLANEAEKKAAKNSKSTKSTFESESRSDNVSIGTSIANQVTVSVANDDGHRVTNSDIDSAAYSIANPSAIETVAEGEVEVIPTIVYQTTSNTRIESHSEIELAATPTTILMVKVIESQPVVPVAIHSATKSISESIARQVAPAA